MKKDNLLFSYLNEETIRQNEGIELIASENFASKHVRALCGSILTNKYAEGFPGKRYYGGCKHIDEIENRAIELVTKLFDCEYACVQPHSGTQANMIAYYALLNTGDKILSLSLDEGGHLSHGSKVSFSSHYYNIDFYHLGSDGRIDYEALRKKALEYKPNLILAGFSAYPFEIDYQKIKEVAKEIGAYFMVDMAHFAGLVAGGVLTGEYNPVTYADVVTTTTHKTLRGPRGGLVLCKKEFAESVDKGCPLVIGGPLPHVMAAKAIAFTEANSPAYRQYAANIVKNCQAFAKACIDLGMKVATGGTDNHLFLIDVTGYGLNGRQAESVVRECGITLNRNALPFDPNGPWYTSGLRIGTAAVTTLGMGEAEMKEIASIFDFVLSQTKPAEITTGEKAGTQSKAKYMVAPEVVGEARSRVKALLDRFPVYPELDLDALKKRFCC